ncbi:hypothetical protein, partial [Pseudomonas rhodesiae]|uniref:hypothetical protein n=1 Tax=Pseudomonas rhodesiae TaxID=76760 RepID=UPI001C86B39A
AVMAESLNCVVYLLMKKPQELDRCPTFGAHFKVEGGRGLAPDEAGTATTHPEVNPACPRHDVLSYAI